jgi:hypothetical protein
LILNPEPRHRWEPSAVHPLQRLPELKTLLIHGFSDVFCALLSIISTPDLEKLDFVANEGGGSEAFTFPPSALRYVKFKAFTSVELNGNALSDTEILSFVAAIPTLTSMTLSHMISIDAILQSLYSNTSIAPQLESLALDAVGCFRYRRQRMASSEKLRGLVSCQFTSSDCSSITSLVLRNVRLYDETQWAQPLMSLDNLHVEIQVEQVHPR